MLPLNLAVNVSSVEISTPLPTLTETEVSVLKRGRNASGCSAPKSANIVDYRRATAVECLFGFLQLTGRKERLEELINIILEKTEEEN